MLSPDENTYHLYPNSSENEDNHYKNTKNSQLIFLLSCSVILDIKH